MVGKLDSNTRLEEISKALSSFFLSGCARIVVNPSITPVFEV
jgi:hypothetical protein